MLILAYSGFRFVYGTKAAAAAASTCVCECVRAPMYLCVCAGSEPYGQLVQPCDIALVYS